MLGALINGVAMTAVPQGLGLRVHRSTPLGGEPPEFHKLVRTLIFMSTGLPAMTGRLNGLRVSQLGCSPQSAAS